MTMRGSDGSGTGTAPGDDPCSVPSDSTQPPGAALGAALGGLAALPDMRVEDHVPVFDAIHQALRVSLADAETGSDRQPL